MYGQGFDEGGTLNHDPDGKSWKERAIERSNRGKRGCFPYAALVETPYGPLHIGDLAVGQSVLSYNDGQFIPRQIIKKIECPPMKVTKVEFDEGYPLRSTWNHVFLTDSGWRRLEKITVGTKLIRANGSSRTVKNVMVSNECKPVFNLYTVGEHNFVVDGCIAHNFSFLRSLRTLFYRCLLDKVVQYKKLASA